MLFRQRKPRAAVTVAAALCMITVLAGCSNGGGGSKTSSAAPPSSSSTASGKNPQITIKGFAFEPSALTVAPGTKITVTNKDSAAHTVTAADKKSFDTDTIAPGQTVTFTAPAKAGKYPYICSIHPFMKGTLTLR
jgi:plastocyanin